MLLCQPELSASPGLPLRHLPPPSPVCRPRVEGLRRPQNLLLLWVSDLLCSPCLQRDFVPLVWARFTSAFRGSERTPLLRGRVDFGHFSWALGHQPLWAVTCQRWPSAPAPWGRIRAKSLVSAAVANGWDNVCRVTGTSGSLSCQLQPRDPEIRGCSHM